MIDYEARVQRGIDLLDRRASSGWAMMISTERLDVSSGADCVLGQVFGSYTVGCKMLGFSGTTCAEHCARSAEHGFALSHEDATSLGTTTMVTRAYNELTTVWVTAIKARRAEIMTKAPVYTAADWRCNEIALTTSVEMTTQRALVTAS
jgi:hypothetical protein